MRENTPINIEKHVDIHLENKIISRGFFLFIFALYAVVCMSKNCYNSSLADIVSEGVLTKSQTGAITAVFYLIYTPFQILGGMIADKYSPERLIKIGLVGATIANVVIFFHQNYYVMLIAWSFNGMIQFGIWPSVFKIVSSQLVRSDRSKMTFYISFAGTAGALVSYLIAALIPDWRYNFAISACFLLAFAIVLHIYGKLLNPYMKWDRKEEIRTEHPEKIQNTSKRMVFAASGFFFVLIGMILSVTVNQTRSSLTSVMFVENYESVAPSLGNILTAVMLLTGMAGNLIVGKFIKKVKNEVVFMLIISVAKLPFLLACTFVGSLPVSVMIVMLSVVACLDSASELIKSYYTMYFTQYGLNGTAAGILNAGNAFSYMVAAYVMPRIVEAFGWHSLMVSLPIMIAISVLCFAAVIRRFRKFKRDSL